MAIQRYHMATLWDVPLKNFEAEVQRIFLKGVLRCGQHWKCGAVHTLFLCPPLACHLQRWGRRTCGSGYISKVQLCVVYGWYHKTLYQLCQEETWKHDCGAHGAGYSRVLEQCELQRTSTNEWLKRLNDSSGEANLASNMMTRQKVYLLYQHDFDKLMPKWSWCTVWVADASMEG